MTPEITLKTGKILGRLWMVFTMCMVAWWIKDESVIGALILSVAVFGVVLAMFRLLAAPTERFNIAVRRILILNLMYLFPGVVVIPLLVWLMFIPMDWPLSNLSKIVGGMFLVIGGAFIIDLCTLVLTALKLQLTTRGLPKSNA
jgi:hypothetical protein